MIRGANDDYVRREVVDLKEQRANDALDLTGLVNIAALLAERVEFIEEKHASSRVSEFKQPSKSGGRLSKKARDQGVVSGKNEGNHQRVSDGLCKRRLSVSRRSDEKNPVAGIQIVGP